MFFFFKLLKTYDLLQDQEEDMLRNVISAHVSYDHHDRSVAFLQMKDSRVYQVKEGNKKPKRIKELSDRTITSISSNLTSVFLSMTDRFVYYRGNLYSDTDKPC